MVYLCALSSVLQEECRVAAVLPLPSCLDHPSHNLDHHLTLSRRDGENRRHTLEMKNLEVRRNQAHSLGVFSSRGVIGRFAEVARQAGVAGMDCGEEEGVGGKKREKCVLCRATTDMDLWRMRKVVVIPPTSRAVEVMPIVVGPVVTHVVFLADFVAGCYC